MRSFVRRSGRIAALVVMAAVTGCGDDASGPEDVVGPRLGPMARSQLSTLLSGEVPEGFRRPGTHLRLASDFITYHISGGQPLRSLQFLSNLALENDA